MFREAQVRAKIIILCRSDLFEQLPGTNTNKLRQDYAIELNWYSPNDEAAPLWKVANQRAAMRTGEETDIATTYFPMVVFRGAGKLRILPKQPAATKDYLLRHTRYTPRDFVRLLFFIQKNNRADTITLDEIAWGLTEYANYYFFPEIKNELAGYIDSTTDVSSILNVFGEIKDELFTIAYLHKRLPQRMHDQLPDILRYLFNASCIGNWDRDEEGAPRIFRYKLPHAHLDLSQPMVLHPALGIAFNVRPITREPGPTPPPAKSHGTVTKISTTAGRGYIEGSDGRIFKFNVHDVVGAPNIRLSIGDEVTFDCPAVTDNATGTSQASVIRLVARRA